MVVLLHFPVSGVAGDYLAAIARIGVPFFFLVSGFFSYSEEYNTKKEIRKIYKYCLLTIGINMVYFAKDIFKVLLNKIELQDLMAKILTPEFLIANFGGSCGHIWFIRALIYLGLFELIFHKAINFKKMKYALPIIWLADALLIKYAFVFGVSIPRPYNEIITKFIGTAFVYYFVGRCIKEHLSLFVEHKQKIWLSVAIIVTLVVLLLAERFILVNWFVNLMPANYIMVMPCTIFIFILLLQNPLWGQGSIFNFVGRELSMYIYYWHGLIGVLIASLVKRIDIISWIPRNVLVVFVNSIIFGYVIYAVKNLIYKKKIIKI